MILQDKMIWTEGMFLMPQHFQQQDRFIESLLFASTQIYQHHFWGIQELKIDHQLLSLGKFSITRCRGVMPDGTLFAFPDRDSAPLPLDIPAGAAQSTIYLALPLRISGMPEVSETFNEKYRYHAYPMEIRDHNAGYDNIAAVQVGKLSLRLVQDKDNRQGLSCLPVAHMLEARANRQLILDEQFIPSCLDIQSVTSLVNILQEIHGLLHYRGDVLAQRLTEPGTGGVAEIADFMLLQLVNRYEPLIRYAAYHQGLHPEYLYQLLLGLAGELATFTRQTRRINELPNYVHSELTATLMPLFVEIRRALSMVQEESAIAIKLEQQSSSLWTAMLADKSLLTKATFIIAVSANMPQETIRKLFPVQTKVAPVEEVRQLVHRALPGIDLYPLSATPRQIPYHANYVYFTISREHSLWEMLAKSASIAFHIGGEFPGLRLELWAIRDK